MLQYQKFIKFLLFCFYIINKYYIHIYQPNKTNGLKILYFKYVKKKKNGIKKFFRIKILKNNNKKKFVSI